MDDDKISFLIWSLTCIFLAMQIYISESNLAALKTEAITNGYAQHNPDTGEWEWITDIKEVTNE